MIQQIGTRYGTMFVPDTDLGQWEWFSKAGASSEDEYITLAADLLDERPKGVFVDVGASWGCWSLELSKHASRVISFEPQRRVFAQLRRSIRANGIDNIRALNVAAGPRIGHVSIADLELDGPVTNFGGLSIGHPLERQPDARMVDVEMIPVDDCIRADETVAFMKIDVEGAETGVLDGALKTIARCRPLMFIEAYHRLTHTPALRAKIEALDYVVDVYHINFLCLPL